MGEVHVLILKDIFKQFDSYKSNCANCEEMAECLKCNEGVLLAEDDVCGAFDLICRSKLQEAAAELDLMGEIGEN